MAKAKQGARASARKSKDRWKAKSWYNLHAPEMFDRQVVGETPAIETTDLDDRVAEVTLQDLTGDFAKMHIKLQFRVSDVRGNDVFTEFVGHDMTSDYVRRLTRRKRSRTDTVVAVTTLDGWRLRVKPMAITDRRINSAKQRAIRDAMAAVVTDTASKTMIGEFVRSMISGDMAKAVAVACKPVQPIQRVEIRRSEVVAMGKVAGPPPEEGEEPEEEETPEEPAAETPPETETPPSPPEGTPPPPPPPPPEVLPEKPAEKPT